MWTSFNKNPILVTLKWNVRYPKSSQVLSITSTWDLGDPILSIRPGSIDNGLDKFQGLTEMIGRGSFNFTTSSTKRIPNKKLPCHTCKTVAVGLTLQHKVSSDGSTGVEI